MIFITLLVYIKDGKEQEFEAFESKAIPMIYKHGGTLRNRIRPNKASIISGDEPTPYEIHIVTFPSQKEFESFAKDEERTKWIHLKDASVDHQILAKAIID